MRSQKVCVNIYNLMHWGIKNEGDILCIDLDFYNSTQNIYGIIRAEFFAYVVHCLYESLRESFFTFVLLLPISSCGDLVCYLLAVASIPTLSLIMIIEALYFISRVNEVFEKKYFENIVSLFVLARMRFTYRDIIIIIVIIIRYI